MNIRKPARARQAASPAGRQAHLSMHSPLLVWRLLAVICLLAGFALLAINGSLPADGASGDLESFLPGGFLVRWIIEPRPGGLRAGDVIVAAEGYTPETWVAGTARAAVGREREAITYVVLRGGEHLVLDVPLAVIRPGALIARWGLQFLVALSFVGTGLYVVRRRPRDLTAHVLMLFCVLIAVQYLGDAHNLQFSTLLWGWPFWFHLVFEHAIFGLTLATITTFALVFPAAHPAVGGHPLRLVAGLLAAYTVTVATAMALAPGRAAAVGWGSNAGWAVAGLQVAIALGAGARSVRVAADPVSRAQTRWLLLCAALCLAVLVPAYVAPLVITGRPPVSHPVVMLITALIPLILAVAILRYRLFDIQVVANRTLVLTLLMVLLAGLYAFLVRIFTLAAGAIWHIADESFVIFAATLVVVMAVGPVRRHTQRLIDRVFFPTRIAYEELVPEISRRLTTHHGVDELAALLVGEVVRRLQITRGELDVLDAGGTTFERVDVRPARASDALDPARNHTRLSAQHALPRTLRRTGMPLHRLDAPDPASTAALDYLAERGAVLAVPLIAGRKLAGIYYLGLKQSGDGYTGEEIGVLHLVCSQVAVALQNARLLAATRRQAEELAGLHEAAVALSSTLVADNVLQTLAQHLGHTLHASYVHIWRVDPQGVAQALAVWHADDVEAPEGERALCATVLRAILELRTVMLDAGSRTVDAAARASASADGWTALLAVPLVQHGRVIGCAEVWETRHARAFEPREVRICQTLATDAAVALEQARLFEAERRQRQLTEALQEAADLVSRTLDLDQLLDRILDQVARVVQGDASNIMLLDEEPAGRRVARVVRCRGYTAFGSEDAMSTLALPVDDYPILTWMAHTGRPAVMPDAAESRFWREIPGLEWQRACVSAPIRVAGETIGFLQVDAATPGAFTNGDAQRLETFAHHAATALHNARLYDQARAELTERRRAEEELRASLADKEVLLREVHHRVKNNLQVISSLLYFQAHTIADPAVLAMFEESQMRVSSMALVHEWLDTTTDVAHVDAAEYVRTLADHLFGAYGAGDSADDGAGRVRLRVETDSVSLGVDEAVPCGLLLHEMISNALKHAFPGGRSGQVCVSLRALPDRDVQLSVADDGVGLPPGVDPGRKDAAASYDTHGLGLRLIHHLVKQIDGDVAVHTDPIAGGTRFDVTFRPMHEPDTRQSAPVLEAAPDRGAERRGQGGPR